MKLNEKLKKPACSKWVELANKSPKKGQYVLVDTKYCKFPAQTALWTGLKFISTDRDRSDIHNVVYWAEINDLHQ